MFSLPVTSGLTRGEEEKLPLSSPLHSRPRVSAPTPSERRQDPPGPSAKPALLHLVWAWANPRAGISGRPPERATQPRASTRSCEAQSPRSCGREECFSASRGLAAHARDDIPHKLNTSAELRQLLPFQLADGRGQPSDPARASRRQNLLAFECRHDVCQPLVARITLPLYEAIFLKPGYYPCHRRRLHLFGAREITEGERAAENHY